MSTTAPTSIRYLKNLIWKYLGQPVLFEIIASKLNEILDPQKERSFYGNLRAIHSQVDDLKNNAGVNAVPKTGPQKTPHTVVVDHHSREVTVQENGKAPQAFDAKKHRIHPKTQVVHNLLGLGPVTLG